MEYDREFMAMAQAARPIDQSDWGSERQVLAQNMFFCRVAELLSEEDFADLEMWCLKATTDEMIDEALRRVAAPTCQHRDSGRGVCVDCGAFLPSSDGDFWGAR